MLDLGFSEMMVIAVVALVVLGPERLPKVARTVGQWVGRMQRYVADVKHDISREMELEELRKFRQTVEQTASSVQSSFNAFETDARSTAGDLEALARGEARGAPVAQDALPTGMPLPGDDVSPVPEALPSAASAEAPEAWVEPTVAGAMASRAGTARYAATASLAMGSPAMPLAGARRWAEPPAMPPAATPMPVPAPVPPVLPAHAAATHGA